MSHASALAPSIDQHKLAPGSRIEVELLFACARLRSDAAAGRTVHALLGGSIDWEFFAHAAREHRVIPLVYHTLSRIGGGRVPPTVLDGLRREYRAKARGNLHFTSELVRVLDAFAANGTPVIPYKGPVLATLIYGDISLRQFGDLDILLHERDIAGTARVLEPLGYKHASDFTGKDVGFLHEAFGITLEVHWSISSGRHPIQVPSERLWQNLRECTLAGRTVRCHSPEDMLWILCVHGGQHRWERLSWLCDVAELVRSGELDWDDALRKTRELRALRTVLVALLVARDLLAVELPADVLRAIDADRTVTPLAEYVKECIGAMRPADQNVGDDAWYNIMLGERLGDRFRIAFKQAVPYLAPTARDQAMLPLPWYFSWVLYLVRPVRLAWSYGLMPLKRIIKGVFES